ncbi:SRP9/SRP21 family protein [Aspergillus clavatus NRRL 1]|uniref:SRP9 domain-containing protein n=1 Tax=Aspergillus clavatus (strain ATCC 1007 / CBS 513.65 / DSM 816 / NCTC 3887 / NRRL 1 / QM 1276 / 107) TaxID=344612 RepID=A1CBH9_ASPCL|nr:uncharacterized protein ACLA_015350 [Aspergillus clavatus NRRL 1]EAW13097.1 conserved hypothetical protein [Aspergillus clavatus NRRL 1]
MPYLSTSQAFLEQSALLLEAYPDTTRITTKYNFPSQRPSQKPSEPSQPDQPAAAAAPVASLTLKTFNTAAGICLKYRTNKAAEVGRLVTSLGKLAAGAGVAGLGLGPAAGTAADVEMVDAPGAVEEGSAPASAAAAAAAAASGKADSGGKGGKGKKKGGKGKR